MTTRNTRYAAGAVAAMGALLMAVVPMTAAHAEPFIDFEHDVSGTSHIASVDSDLPIGPTTLSTTLDQADFSFTGSLPIPSTRSSFEVIGFIPIEATVTFEEVAPVQGDLEIGSTTTEVHATAKYHIRLSDIEIVGFPTFTGRFCRTKEPVTIPVNTPEGENFNLISGGPLEGTFSIGDFQHCGLNTWLINTLIPGNGNTVDLDVSNGRVV